LETCRRFELLLRDLPRVADLGLAGPATILLGEVYAGTARYGVTHLGEARAAWTSAAKTR
jgi:hypothetical protein